MHTDATHTQLTASHSHTRFNDILGTSSHDGCINYRHREPMEHAEGCIYESYDILIKT